MYGKFIYLNLVFNTPCHVQAGFLFHQSLDTSQVHKLMVGGKTWNKTFAWANTLNHLKA